MMCITQSETYCDTTWLRPKRTIVAEAPRHNKNYDRQIAIDNRLTNQNLIKSNFLGKLKFDKTKVQYAELSLSVNVAVMSSFTIVQTQQIKNNLKLTSIFGKNWY